MTWIKRQILKTLLRFLNKISGGMRVLVARRADIYARVYRNGKWEERKMLRRGLRFRNNFIKR